MHAVLDYLEKRSAFCHELCAMFVSPAFRPKPSSSGQKAAAAGLSDTANPSAQDATLPNPGEPGRRRSNTALKIALRPKTHFLIYGHYDVQPANHWTCGRRLHSSRVSRAFLFGRGASDNKGQHFAHIKAVEAFLKTARNCLAI